MLPMPVVVDRCQCDAPPFVLTEHGILIADANVPCSAKLRYCLLRLDSSGFGIRDLNTLGINLFKGRCNFLVAVARPCRQDCQPFDQIRASGPNRNRCGHSCRSIDITIARTVDQFNVRIKAILS